MSEKLYESLEPGMSVLVAGNENHKEPKHARIQEVIDKKRGILHLVVFKPEAELAKSPAGEVIEKPSSYRANYVEHDPTGKKPGTWRPLKS